MDRGIVGREARSAFPEARKEILALATEFLANGSQPLRDALERGSGSGRDNVCHVRGAHFRLGRGE